MQFSLVLKTVLAVVNRTARQTIEAMALITEERVDVVVICTPTGTVRRCAVVAVCVTALGFTSTQLQVLLIHVVCYQLNTPTPTLSSSSLMSSDVVVNVVTDIVTVVIVVNVVGDIITVVIVVVNVVADIVNVVANIVTVVIVVNVVADIVTVINVVVNVVADIVTVVIVVNVVADIVTVVIVVNVVVNVVADIVTVVIVDIIIIVDVVVIADVVVVIIIIIYVHWCSAYWCQPCAVDQWCLQSFLGMKWIFSNALLTLTIQAWLLFLYEHITCMDANDEVKKILRTSTLKDWKRTLACPQITWMKTTATVTS